MTYVTYDICDIWHIWHMTYVHCTHCITNINILKVHLCWYFEKSLGAQHCMGFKESLCDLWFLPWFVWYVVFTVFQMWFVVCVPTLMWYLVLTVFLHWYDIWFSLCSNVDVIFGFHSVPTGWRVAKERLPPLLTETTAKSEDTKKTACVFCGELGVGRGVLG